MTQRNKFKVFAYSFLLIIALISFFFIWQMNSAKGRDYQRLGDLKQIQQTLADYFFKYNTYQIDGCNPPAVLNTCLGGDERRIDLSRIIDPINARGYQYRIVSLGDDDFEVDFALETDVSGLLKGAHSYTKNGIKQ